MKRKIDAMHQYYGYGPGRCEDCRHLTENKALRVCFKCRVYGEDDGPATDWRKDYIACGLIGKPFPESDVRISRIVERPKQDNTGQLPGQLTLDLTGFQADESQKDRTEKK